MAGMFYSLQEAAEKLSLTKEKLKEFIKQGRLREFRDGPNVLFKVNEVEALMSDTSIMASEGISAGPDEDEISLAPESAEDTAVGGELADADTAIAGQGINVLGETDSEYQITDDTLAETKGTTGEASLEEIEGDVSLDSFGSGSGLLDLSLQADDTSLGGILDEIYTPEGGEDQEAGEAGSAVEVAAETEAEEMLSEEEELAGPQPVLKAPAIAQAYVEPQPDALSNALGIMLFLPLLTIVYTIIVAVAGFKGVMPAVLEKMQGIIWYILFGLVVAAIVIAGMGFMLGGKAGKVGKKRKAKAAPQPEPADETV